MKYSNLNWIPFKWEWQCIFTSHVHLAGSSRAQSNCWIQTACQWPLIALTRTFQSGSILNVSSMCNHPGVFLNQLMISHTVPSFWPILAVLFSVHVLPLFWGFCLRDSWQPTDPKPPRLDICLQHLRCEWVDTVCGFISLLLFYNKCLHTCSCEYDANDMHRCKLIIFTFIFQ